ncbi:putative signal transducing protein [Corallococcus sp. M7]
MGIPDHDFQLLTTCGDESEAALVRALLQADNIPCIVQGEQHRSMLGVAGAYIELRVLVPARELDHARELLKSVARGEPPVGFDSEPDTDSEEAHCALHAQRATGTCQRCGTFLCASCDGASAGLCEDCAERNGSGAELQRGRKRKVVAWMILLFLFGPPFLLMLASTLNALLN